MNEISIKNEAQMYTGHDYPLFDLDEALEVLSYAELAEPNIYEIIWVKITGTDALPPANFIRIGYEPSWFPESCASALGSCKVDPRDLQRNSILDAYGPKELAYVACLEKLNKYGLFDNEEIAIEFIKIFLSVEWTESGRWIMTEIWISKEVKEE